MMFWVIFGDDFPIDIALCSIAVQRFSVLETRSMKIPVVSRFKQCKRIAAHVVCAFAEGIWSQQPWQVITLKVLLYRLYTGVSYLKASGDVRGY